jgi:single-strand DNA-binding protein
MSGTTNKVILIGNLGKAPEIRQLQSGNFVANFSIATHEHYKDKQGEKKEVTDWHNIQVYTPGIIQIIKEYVQKGTKIYLEGSLKCSKYQDEYGKDRYRNFVKISDKNHKLILLDKKQEKTQLQNTTSTYTNSNYERMKEEGY